VRICGGRRVRFPPATRQNQMAIDSDLSRRASVRVPSFHAPVITTERLRDRRGKSLTYVVCDCSRLCCASTNTSESASRRRSRFSPPGSRSAPLRSE